MVIRAREVFTSAAAARSRVARVERTDTGGAEYNRARPLAVVSVGPEACLWA